METTSKKQTYLRHATLQDQRVAFNPPPEGSTVNNYKLTTLQNLSGSELQQLDQKILKPLGLSLLTIPYPSVVAAAMAPRAPGLLCLALVLQRVDLAAQIVDLTDQRHVLLATEPLRIINQWITWLIV